jgi:RPA family protein
VNVTVEVGVPPERAVTIKSIPFRTDRFVGVVGKLRVWKRSPTDHESPFVTVATVSVTVVPPEMTT